MDILAQPFLKSLSLKYMSDILHVKNNMVNKLVGSWQLAVGYLNNQLPTSCQLGIRLCYYNNKGICVSYSGLYVQTNNQQQKGII